MATALSNDLLVDRDNLRHIEARESELTVQPGEALVKIDRFALTANNVTYAVAGDLIGYWSFFPAPEGLGRVPVWGFGDVVESHADGLSPGTRLYGYWPMSTYLKILPVRVKEDGLFDGAAHRQALPQVYNRYQRTDADPAYRAEREREHALLRPLFITSFVIDDFLADNDFFGAKDVVITSASSKTSIGLGWSLARRAGLRPATVGLTSPGNKAFVEGLKIYDRVMTYDEIGQLDGASPTIFVDMAGNQTVLAALHRHFADACVYSCRVGGTHWEAGEAVDPGNWPGPAPKFFFAPDQITKRVADWGADGFARRQNEAWFDLLPFIDSWLQLEDVNGVEATAAAFRHLVDGGLSPSVGLTASLWK